LPSRVKSFCNALKPSSWLSNVGCPLLALMRPMKKNYLWHFKTLWVINGSFKENVLKKVINCSLLHHKMSEVIWYALPPFHQWSRNVCSSDQISTSSLFLLHIHAHLFQVVGAPLHSPNNYSEMLNLECQIVNLLVLLSTRPVCFTVSTGGQTTQNVYRTTYPLPCTH